MPDDPTPPQDDPQEPDENQNPDPPEQPDRRATDPDADLLEGARNPDAVKNALQKERQAARDAQKRAEEAEAKVKDFEDRNKSDQEKLQERTTTLEGENGQLAGENLRLRVALEKKLPVELIDRLKGGTKDEIEADADELLKLVGPDDRPDFDGGARRAAPAAQDMNDLLRKASGRQ